MPPQPIWSIREDAKATANPNMIRRQPALAVHIAEIIALWSRIETTLGGVLALMLDAGVRPSMAMYGAIQNSRAQMDALEAAAKSVLSEGDFELFGAVMTIIKRAAAKRHKIAHWVWAYSAQIPDALVLIDPDAFLEYNVKSSELIAAVKAGDFSVTSTEVDLSRAFAYRDKDFLEIINELRNAMEVANIFAGVANLSGVDDGPRHQLLALPQIQEALQRIRARSRNEK
jgi:hypothetical protein